MTLEVVVGVLIAVVGFQVLGGDADRVDSPGGWVALATGWALAAAALVVADAATRVAARRDLPVDRVGNGPWMVLAVEAPLVLVAGLASVMDSGMS